MNLKYNNPNTPTFWDKALFSNNRELIQSPYYLDKLNMVYRFVKNKKGNFLDVGFGMGNLEKLLSKKDHIFKIFGTDFSTKAVAHAKKTLEGKYCIADVQKLPFKKNFFDIVVMLDVYEHITRLDSRNVLKEIVRVLKLNGFFVISVPINENLKIMNRNGINYNAHVRQFIGPDLIKELEKFGFYIFQRKYIYAFRKFYYIKKFIIKIFPNFRKPNVLILFCKKIK